jgi:hypothetical protein
VTLGVFHLVQLALVAAIVTLALHRARDLGGAAGLASERLLKRHDDDVIDAIAAHGESSVLGELARAAALGDVVELETAIQEQRARLSRGLAALRVLGAAATALGFAGALFDIAWVGQDHGILDLDPTRIARLGLESAALAMALGIGGSGLALSMGMALRARARALSRDLDRFARRLSSPA